MDSLALIRIHLALECVGVAADNLLFRIPCANPDTLHRVYVARHDQGDTLFFRADLSEAVRKKLLRLPIADFFEDSPRVAAVLGEESPCEEIHIGKSYLFPDTLTPAQYPGVVPLSQLDPEIIRRYDAAMDVGQREIFGFLADGLLVSTCESARENDTAGEAWVRTLEGYRRRGYARLVTAAWGHSLQRRGKIPFYSHTRNNFASQGVAQSLGLIQYLQDAGYV